MKSAILSIFIAVGSLNGRAMLERTYRAFAGPSRKNGPVSSLKEQWPIVC